MYTEYNKVDEIPKDITKNFRLCYIESHCYEIDDRGFASNDGNKHLHLFFTNCNINLQWGDDWGDKPYEYNAGQPYSEHYEGNKRVPHEVIKVCVTLKRDSGEGYSYYYYLPEDFAYTCPYSSTSATEGLEDVHVSSTISSSSYTE